MIRVNPCPKILQKENLDKKQTNSNRSKNKRHSNPDFAAGRHFSLGIQIISKGDTDENDSNGNENNA